jgi:hypothetical protein
VNPNALRLCVFHVVLGLYACSSQPPTSASTPMGPNTMTDRATSTTTGDLVDAVALAEREFGAASATPSDYALIRAQRLLAGGDHCTGTRCWQLTFKLSRLIPTATNPRIGAGGELFFVVDVERGTAMLTGRGE